MLSLSSRLRASSRASELAAERGTAHTHTHIHMDNVKIESFSYLILVRTFLCPSIGSCLSFHLPPQYFLGVEALTHSDAYTVW